MFEIILIFAVDFVCYFIASSWVSSLNGIIFELLHFATQLHSSFDKWGPWLDVIPASDLLIKRLIFFLTFILDVIRLLFFLSL